MRILVTGASGFVGSLLVPRLHAQGHQVRALGRDPNRVRAALTDTSAREVEVVRADALTGEGLADALVDVEVAYYLIHSIERQRAGEATYPERDHAAAENFAAAAARAHVRRIVYLGGLLPPADRDSARARTSISRHLASREDVGRVLLTAVPDSLALRASIIIGARSRSFRLLVHLLERMPVLTLPAWRDLRTQPIDERDVIDMLLACVSAQPTKRTLDIGGPDALSYGEMLQTIAELMLVNRPALGLGVNLTGITARVAAALAGEDPELVLALMEGLQADLLLADDHAAQLLGVRLHSFAAAVEHALGEWERREPLAAR
jgi:uncharacterized protein YbjT (DUF2867 family)